MNWHEAVLFALHRISNRHRTKIISRQQLIREELDRITKEVSSEGATPWQTMSRILQELRDENIIEFLEKGKYLLIDNPIYVEDEDLTNEALDYALQNNVLKFGHINTSSKRVLTRQRQGQARIRELALINYSFRCAFCDILDKEILVTSHISRWADDPAGRGDLTNVICMCKPHDALFEFGYFSLSDSYNLIIRKNIISNTVNALINIAVFSAPVFYPPNQEYLRIHRRRVGLDYI